MRKLSSRGLLGFSRLGMPELKVMMQPWTALAVSRHARLSFIWTFSKHIVPNSWRSANVTSRDYVGRYYTPLRGPRVGHLRRFGFQNFPHQILPLNPTAENGAPQCYSYSEVLERLADSLSGSDKCPLWSIHARQNSFFRPAATALYMHSTPNSPFTGALQLPLPSLGIAWNYRFLQPSSSSQWHGANKLFTLRQRIK